MGAAWGAYRRLHRPSSLEGSYVDAPTKVLIIGGGFGGLAVARGLARDLSGTADVGVALVDHLNYTTFWPMVPSIIPSNAEVRHVAHSLRRILKPLGIEYFQGQVAGVNFEPARLPLRLPRLGPGQPHDILRYPRRRRERPGCQGNARRTADPQSRDRPIRGSRAPRGPTS